MEHEKAFNKAQWYARGELIAALMKFESAAYTLNALFDAVDSDGEFAPVGYPFPDAFEEVCLQISKWREAISNIPLELPWPWCKVCGSMQEGVHIVGKGCSL